MYGSSKMQRNQARTELKASSLQARLYKVGRCYAAFQGRKGTNQEAYLDVNTTNNSTNLLGKRARCCYSDTAIMGMTNTILIKREGPTAEENSDSLLRIHGWEGH